jgi:hypothetical protein
VSNASADHLTLPVLWAYARNSDPATLTIAHFNHLKTCEECTRVLWLCSTAYSIEDVKAKLKDRSINNLE